MTLTSSSDCTGRQAVTWQQGARESLSSVAEYMGGNTIDPPWLPPDTPPEL